MTDRDYLIVEGGFTEDQADAILAVLAGTVEDSGWRYFRREEFRCRCGKCDTLDRLHGPLVDILDKLRHQAGVPCVITSGVRCEKHNASPAVGGAVNSYHCRGRAADFRLQGLSAQRSMSMIRSISSPVELYAIDEYHVHFAI